jgi:hypothetical protein
VTLSHFIAALLRATEHSAHALFFSRSRTSIEIVEILNHHGLYSYSLFSLAFSLVASLVTMFVHRRSVNKLAHCFIVVFWLLFSASSSATKVNVSMADTMEESMSQGVNVVKKMANQIETTYASLSPRNQLIASGLTGFVVSRMVVHSAIGALKVGLAAYVV